MLINEEIYSRIKETGIDEKIIKIFESGYQEFCKQIMMELSTFSFEESRVGFSSLNLYSNEYRVQKHFERVIETYVRECLVKNVLKNILEDHGYSVVAPSYELYDNEYTNGDIFISNEEFENRAGFEFVIFDKDRRIGCRFTNIYASEAKKWFSSGIVSEIIVIDWYKPKGISEKEKKNRTYGAIGNVDILGIDEFTTKWIGKTESKAYSVFIHGAIQNYQEIIGISSLPKLTAPMLLGFRIEKETNLKDEIWNDYLKIQNDNLNKHFGYTLIDPSIFKRRDQEYKENIETDTEFFLLNSSAFNNYKNKKLYKALIGRGEFSKSFLTSEYLFTQYNKSDLFDYTAIVSGYIKSIEQLLYSFVLSFIDKKYTDNNEEKNFNIKKTGSWDYIPFITERKEEVDFSLGSLIYFIKNYKDCLLSGNGQDKKTIINCLHCYRIECRNDSFHKDNNYKWDRVETIRHNTFFLYIMLLGSFIFRDGTHLQETLKIVSNDGLERIYYKLKKDGVNTFRVKFNYDENIYLASRQPELSFPSIDNYGFLNDDFAINVRCNKENSTDKTDYYFSITVESLPELLWIRKTMIDNWHEIEFE